jgi:hypothetical protein
MVFELNELPSKIVVLRTIKSVIMLPSQNNSNAEDPIAERLHNIISTQHG